MNSDDQLTDLILDLPSATRPRAGDGEGDALESSEQNVEASGSNGSGQDMQHR